MNGNKINIFFFASDYSIGLSNLLTEQVRNLSRISNINLVAVAGEKEQTVNLNKVFAENAIKLIRINGLDRHTDFLELVKLLNRTLQRLGNFEFVHVQNNWQLALVVFLKYFFRHKFKIIYTIHGYRHNSLIKSIIARFIIDVLLFLFADIVFACSSFVQKKFFFVKKKIRLLFLGVDEIYFNAGLKLDFPRNKAIIFAGQFRPGKNQDMLIRALAYYKNTTGDKDFKLFLPGEGPLKEKCVMLVEELGLTSNIFFPGQLNKTDVLNIYTKCSIAIIPSNAETFGHCIAEPFVLGNLVITRDTGISLDIIEDGVTGFLFKNLKELEVLLVKYLCNESIKERIRKNALKQRDKLNWKFICDLYSNTLLTELNKKP